MARDLKKREAERLAALRETGLLDSPAEPLFDLITQLAAKAIHVPVVLMSLVDSDRQFFKSQCGLPAPWAERRETPLSHSFCQYVALVGEALVVEDARLHPLVRDNLAVSEINVIAYAGIPLVTEDGFTLGSLCAIDSKPRRWTTPELELLDGFARQIMTEINLRTLLRRREDDVESLRNSADALRARSRHIVHDLRTPLNALYLTIDGLAASGELNADQSTCLELMRRNAGVLRDLVNKLIETKAGSAKTKRTHCAAHELLVCALDQVAPLADRAGIRLDCSETARLPAVSVRAPQLTRVLVNLIANAVKFTPRGGEVRVSAAREQLSGDAVIRFSVRDTGIGIAAEDQQRIFDEGVRLNEEASAQESTGIGLAFCTQILSEHGSWLEVESAPGQGSTFSFTLPVAPALPQRRVKRSAPASRRRPAS